MLTIQPHEVTPAILNLFDLNNPTMPRAFSVLEGIARGTILVESSERPRWAVVRDAAFGTLYFGGKVEGTIANSVLEHFLQTDDVGFGCWLEDELNSIPLPQADYDGRTLYYTERSPQVDLPTAPHPSSYALVKRDINLLRRSTEYQWNLDIFGSEEVISRETIGYVILHEGQIVSEAGTGAATHNMIEVGVNTAEEHRQRGLGWMVCAQLIAECEARGLRTWWDCAKQNIPSIKLAEKLGYINGREYRYRWWKKK